MKIEQLYTSCLAQGAYYIESMGEAVIIDPLRDTQQYLEKARADGAEIKYIFETHFHADFVSGHVELAAATEAVIVFGPGANTAFPAYIAEDGTRIRVGNVSFEVLHTPGHTLESVCYLLRDEEDIPRALFSGDTLFIGDVGRPDLAQHNLPGMTKEKLAGMLYESLRRKIFPLADEVIVYPAHGAGSACGKHMRSETFDTLANQKRTNYALQSLDKDQFIALVLQGLELAPAYFPQNVHLNSGGYEGLESVVSRALKPLVPADFNAMKQRGNYLVLDTRPASEFAQAHIPGSINIGLKGSFAPWVGVIVANVTQPILIVAGQGEAQEVAIRLARVGFDNSRGYLDGGLATWIAEGYQTQSVSCIAAADFSEHYKGEAEACVFDVRTTAEFAIQHIEGAKNKPLAKYQEYSDLLEQTATCYVYCAGGYRSMLFISLMLRAGMTAKLINLDGGFNALKNI